MSTKLLLAALVTATLMGCDASAQNAENIKQFKLCKDAGMHVYLDAFLNVRCAPPFPEVRTE